ncbi:hypothetical protein PHMEG_00023888 [Phytophthora megakarya]|uniref:Zinc ion binding protein n=1 Tax=Phytophthora megakarya TaxID=4795 RepID=A0A225VI99_9STRA|nr:hypothetical protein PHMEG_00023888 [Phytophthora megakarya]
MGDVNGDAPLGKWAQRKEARRNMYATSTEQVRVHRRGLGTSSASITAAMCQKCLRPGHWTYECKNEAVYVQRPSRSQQLKNPKLRQPFNMDKPPELLEEVQTANGSQKLKRKDKEGKKRLRSHRTRRRSVSSSSNNSDSSSSESDSSDSDSSGSYSSSDSDASGSDSDSSSSSSGSDHNARTNHRTKRRCKG